MQFLKFRCEAIWESLSFGWDGDKPGVQFNQLVVTQEQLEQIRALRSA
jgi:hypothetical protein